MTVHSYTVKSNASRAMKAFLAKNQIIAPEALTVEQGDEGFVVKAEISSAKFPAPSAAARAFGFDVYEPKVVEVTPEPEAAPRASGGKRAEVVKAAEAGVVPATPDFSAAVHKRNRARLDQVLAMIEAKDIEGLEAFPINPNCTSPKALNRFRNLAVTALKAQAESRGVAA